MTYATDAVKISSQKHLLLEVEPAEPLWNWALTGGQSNTYEASWSHIAQATVVKGGIYRRLVGMEEDGTALTEAGSIANVEANAGYYYHDESAQKIYVHTTGTADPDTLDMMVAVFRIHFSTTGGIPIEDVGTDARDFDGTNDWYTKGAALDGAADSETCIFSCWFRLDGAHEIGFPSVILDGRTVAAATFRVSWAANDYMRCYVISSDGLTIVVDVISRETYIADGLWHHIYISLFMTIPWMDMYIDGVYAKGAETQFSRSTLHFTATQWDVASFNNGVSSKLNGGISELYFNPGEFLPPGGWKKFRNIHGSPVSLGDTGELPTGNSPAIYLPDGDASNNLGTGGDFSAAGSPAEDLGPANRKGIYYEKRMLVGTEISVSEKTSDLMVGLSRSASGSVRLANHDNLFDIPAANWSWKNRAARYLFGIDDAGLESYITVRELVVDDIAHTERDLEIILVDGIDAWRKRFPPTPNLSGTAYGEGVSGTRVPILIGVKTDIIPDLVDNEDAQGNAWKYKIADESKQDLDAVSAVYAIDRGTGARQTLTLAVDYTVSLTDCSITVNDSFDVGAEIEEVYEIRCDATGQPAGTFDTSTDYLKWPGEIARWLLNTFLNIKDINLDLNSFWDADTEAPYELAFWIKSETNVREVLRTLGKSVLGDVRTGISSVTEFYLWAPWKDTADTESYTDEDFSMFKGDPKMETIYYKTDVRYDEDPANPGSFEIASVTDNATNYLVKGAQVLTVDTFLKSSADALLMAQRINFLYRGIKTEIKFRERGIRLMGAGRNTRIQVTKTRAPSADGSYTSKLMEVIELSKNLMTPAITGRLSESRADLIGQWTAATAPDFSTATDEEKASSGFWTDASGLADASDRSSKNLSLWWSALPFIPLFFLSPGSVTFYSNTDSAPAMTLPLVGILCAVFVALRAVYTRAAMSPFHDRVMYIVEARTKEQMIRAAAHRIVARVKHALSFWDRSNGERIGKSVRPDQFRLPADMTIATRSRRTSPQPAFRSTFHTFPKLLRCIHDHLLYHMWW